jgi:hypothetical protein
MPLQRFTLSSMTRLAKVSPQMPLLHCSGFPTEAPLAPCGL